MTVTIDIDRDGWTAGLQVSINKTDMDGTGHGYRLAGPKYNGSSTRLWSAPLSADDAIMALMMLEGLDRAELEIEQSGYDRCFRVSLETASGAGWLTDPAVGDEVFREAKRVKLDSHDLAEVRRYLQEVSPWTAI